LSIWTKLEGIFYITAFTPVIFIHLLLKKDHPRQVLRAMTNYSIPVFIIGIPWFSFLLLNNIPVFSRGYEKISTDVLHFEVLPVIWRHIMYYANFNIIFAFVFLTLLFGAKTICKTKIKYLYAVLFGVMQLFLAAYILTDNYRWVMNAQGVNRNIMTFLPFAYYVSLLTTIKVLKKQVCNDQEDLREKNYTIFRERRLKR
jgi:hypothetical protein